MTTFPTSQWGRLPPIINGTAGKEIVAERYTVNLQLNSCHPNAAETSSSLLKGQLFRYGDFLFPPVAAQFFITHFINCLAQLWMFFTYRKWCRLSNKIKRDDSRSSVEIFCKCANMMTRMHLNASCTHAHIPLMGGVGRGARVTDGSWHGVNSFNDGRHDSCQCVRGLLARGRVSPRLYWSCARGVG